MGSTTFYQNRLNWQAYLTQQFEQELIDKAALMALFKDRKMLWSPAYKNQMQTNQQAFKDLILVLSSSLTVQQKSHLSIELDGYIEDLKYLAESK